MGKRTTRVKGIAFAVAEAEVPESEIAPPATKERRSTADVVDTPEHEVVLEAHENWKKRKKGKFDSETVADEEAVGLGEGKKHKKRHSIGDAQEEAVAGVFSKTRRHKSHKGHYEEGEELQLEQDRKEKTTKRREKLTKITKTEFEDGPGAGKDEKKNKIGKFVAGGEGKSDGQRKKRPAQLEQPGMLAMATKEEAGLETSRKAKKCQKRSDDGEAADTESNKELADLSKKQLTVYIAGIPWSCDEDRLKKKFGECGKLSSVNMPLNDKGKPRGIAFITFDSRGSVTEALKFDGIEYGGRTLSVKLADKAKNKGNGKASAGKGKGNKDFEVFICGLPFETDEAVLRKDFEECGEIASLNMLKKPDGTCRGVAFITFRDMDSVRKACEYNGTEYGGRWIQVEKSGEGKGSVKDKIGAGKGESS